ncbi:MAG: hypothetical protein WDA22_07650 [Bacteroidota bacterium]
MKRFLFILIVCAAGCSTSIPIPSEDDLPVKPAMQNSISIEDLRSGRQLYITKCSGCHSLYLPSTYSAPQWDTILPMMALKSKITEIESGRIKQYLFLYASKETTSTGSSK